jgi:hypothetical protein
MLGEHETEALQRWIEKNRRARMIANVHPAVLSADGSLKGGTYTPYFILLRYIYLVLSTGSDDPPPYL